MVGLIAHVIGRTRMSSECEAEGELSDGEKKLWMR
jgi:hypothetical protein